MRAFGGGLALLRSVDDHSDSSKVVLPAARSRLMVATPDWVCSHRRQAKKKTTPSQANLRRGFRRSLLPRPAEKADHGMV